MFESQQEIWQWLCEDEGNAVYNIIDPEQSYHFSDGYLLNARNQVERNRNFYNYKDWIK